ncbi:MAG TPA: hypothetical protein VIG24_02115 [Acidimicrobiia bacterium]
MITEHPDPERRWRNRRRMAWLSLLAGLVVYPALAAWTGSAVLGEIAWPLYTLAGVVVGTYIGSAAYETVKTQGPR